MTAIPARFLERARDLRWWWSHLLLDEPDDDSGMTPWWRDHLDEDVAVALRFPVLDAELDLSVTSTRSELGLVPADGGRADLGWDDGAHFHPHLLRWVELEALVAHTTARPPWSDHPDLALALLHRFAVGTTDDDIASSRSRVVPALSRIGLPPDWVDRVVARLDWRPGSRPGGDDELVGPGWVRDPEVGWRLDLWWRRDREHEGDGAWRAPYTLRQPGNPSFPGAELNRLLEQLLRRQA